jgi:formylglycine-generating enzyme required for sulfatase activity
MTDKPRSRHIPKKVVTQLLEAQRHRCCVRSPVCSGVLLDPDNYDPEALAETLDMHHIVMFAHGGAHTYDNLLLACDNCHEQVHRHPDEYPPDVLQAKKEHWAGMRDVVPVELELPHEADCSLRLPFLLVTVNLPYTITASPQTTVGELALFVREAIHRPIGRYDENEKWIKAEGIQLARRSASTTPLDPDWPLEKVHLAPNDVLVARIRVPAVTVVIPPIPGPPGSGEEEGEGSSARKTRQPTWERRHPFEPEMVFVPAGPFWMGTDRRRLERAGVEWWDRMEMETPYHQVDLPDYWIGRFPVTNAEYQAFIEGGGYQTRAYWTEAGWGWKGDRTQPAYWTDEEYGGPRQPVLGVSWYEAVAYCRWLSASTGQEYRLPSEAEWEKAARGTDGRIWPWGDEWDPTRCNVGEGGLHRPTPVGKYSPRGDSPYDCADMAGNVWEWCATKWEDSYENYRGDDNLEGNARRVLRGGSFVNSAGPARCACRDWPYGPVSRDRYAGFRVVVAAPFSRPARSEA